MKESLVQIALNLCSSNCLKSKDPFLHGILTKLNHSKNDFENKIS